MGLDTPTPRFGRKWSCGTWERPSQCHPERNLDLSHLASTELLQESGQKGKSWSSEMGVQVNYLWNRDVAMYTQLSATQAQVHVYKRNGVENSWRMTKHQTKASNHVHHQVLQARSENEHCVVLPGQQSSASPRTDFCGWWKLRKCVWQQLRSACICRPRVRASGPGPRLDRLNKAVLRQMHWTFWQNSARGNTVVLCVYKLICRHSP